MQVLENIAVGSNQVYVIPPNHHLTLGSEFLRLQPMQQPRPLPKAIDRLFISLAEEQQEEAICIILTGADHGGTVGLKAVNAAGGMVMARLPETAQHPGMPESAVGTGMVDYVLSIEEMGGAPTPLNRLSGCLFKRGNRLQRIRLRITAAQSGWQLQLDAFGRRAAI